MKDLRSSRATSILMEAALSTDPITYGKYGSNWLPKILQIRAHAEIIYANY